MEQNTPKQLFRVWSDDTWGNNSNNLFVPAAIANYKTAGAFRLTPQSLDDFEQQFQRALRKNAANCPFFFSTSSLLVALQHASRETGLGKANVHITCFNTDTTKTPEGQQVKFYSVKALMKDFNIEIRNGGGKGSIRESEDEYVTMSAAIPGKQSCCVRYETLMSNGLFQLYPSLKEVNEGYRGRPPKWYSAIFKLRRHGFRADRLLTKEKIDAAARLAFSFKKCVAGETTNHSNGTPERLLAWFLALQKRSKTDPSLETWLDSHSTLDLEVETQSSRPPKLDTSIRELAQYSELFQLFEGREVLQSGIQAAAHISPAVIEAEKSEWQTWCREDADEHRRTKAADREIRPSCGRSRRRTRYDRSTSPGRSNQRDGRAYRRRDQS